MEYIDEFLINFTSINRYHCMYSENEPDNDDQSDDEERFVKVAHDLRGKYNVMKNKYQLLLMKESMVSQIGPVYSRYN